MIVDFFGCHLSSARPSKVLRSDRHTVRELRQLIRSSSKSAVRHTFAIGIEVGIEINDASAGGAKIYVGRLGRESRAGKDVKSANWRR